MLVGGIVGGVVNLATNWKSIDNVWEGVAAFGVGAGAGVLTAATGGATAGIFATTTAAVGGAVLGGGLTAATNSVISQTGNGIGLGDVQWGQVGGQALIGGMMGGMTYGIGSAYTNTGFTNSILDASGITNNVARNLVGSTVNGAVIGTSAGLVNGVTTGLVTGDWNIGQHMLKGGLYGAAGGFLYGGLTELGYQAQLKWGRRNGLNSNVTEAIADGGKTGIKEQMRIEAGPDGGGGPGGEGVNGALPGDATGIGEITVLYNTKTGVTTVYINYWNPNSYWQPPAFYNPPSNPQLPFILNR